MSVEELVKRLRGVDHMSVEDCFLQSPLFGHAADKLEELAAENERLKEDRARFPDRPDDIGRMIEAHIGNLKAGKKSAEALADKAFDRAFRAEAALAASAPPNAPVGVEEMQRRLDREESDHERTIDQRDAAEDALGRMFQAVTGRPAEWSSAWGYVDAIEEVEEHVAALASERAALAEKDKEIAALREALEHVTELLADTWNTKMDGDPERQVAIRDARAALRGKIDE